jgi:hypothetical protein
MQGFLACNIEKKRRKRSLEICYLNIGPFEYT